MISHSPSEMSTTLMWLAISAVVAFSFIAGIALLGWLPMSASQLTEEVPSAPPSGKAKHRTAIALHLGANVGRVSSDRSFARNISAPVAARA